MKLLDYLLLGLLVALGLYVLYRLRLAIGQFLRFHGEMLVTCPETQRPAAVKVNNWRALLAPAAAPGALQLSACSRWPQRRDCGQQCACQIEENPDAHRVWSIAAHWYEGKECAYCGRAIELIHADHPPALLDAEKQMQEWTGVAAEKLQEALAGSLPVCWNCYVTESFIREHPGSTVVRPWKHAPLWTKN
jgi:hypothetical protein